MVALSVQHNVDRHMAELHQVLALGRKRVGFLIGAGAPTSIKLDNNGEVVPDGKPLIPAVEPLTEQVIESFEDQDLEAITLISEDLQATQARVNVEDILSHIRKLASVIGQELIHGLDGRAYQRLADDICGRIGNIVQVDLPAGRNPFSRLASWIGGTRRQHAVEVFTPNYDLLLEKAFERNRLPFFDGFVGVHEPFFDPTSIYSDSLPPSWSRIWKLHGSIGWSLSDGTIVRAGGNDATSLIYPEHLKFEQVTRLPYSALFEHLRAFLSQPDTLLLCSGFSFRDAHISAVIDEALTANSHVAVLAMQYRKLAEEEEAVKIAESHPNFSAYAEDGAVVDGIAGNWMPDEHVQDERQSMRQCYWSKTSDDEVGRFVLGDFNQFAEFLALTQAERLEPHGNREGDLDMQQDDSPVARSNGNAQ